MTNNLTARKDGQWLVISMLPDVCKTPIGGTDVPVPYPIIAKCGDAAQEVPHVRANGMPFITLASYLPTTTGAEPGVKKGLVSDTVGGTASFKSGQHSSTVNADKQRILRHGDLFWMNGEATGNAPSQPKPSPVEARKARYQEREDLIEKNAGSTDPNIIAASERLNLNNDNILRAEAAEYVYKVDEFDRGHTKALPEPPVGLELQDPSKIPGLEDATFMSEESGFGSALFKSEINGETMLTYRGTNNSVTGLLDWGTNLGQSAGFETAQYNDAMELAKKTEQALGDSFSIVGHSLGGGLASAGVAVTGTEGYTFNSAGLHPNTIEEKSDLSEGQISSLITSQHVLGEVLTGVQTYTNPVISGLAAEFGAKEGGALGAAAATIAADQLLKIPGALGDIQKLDSVEGGSPLSRHGMDQVIDGIEAQKETDIATLQGASPE
ncbi:PAAR-like domain-containing protein [uncultured Gilvimarinus sp.]|uniref:PAAR-like domain-containing protein n=1 Tax=uncultured Gilvimarinus sp. TaxID=1689143 RepID=UPI0030D7F424